MATETGGSAETGSAETGDSVSPYVRGVTVTTISTLSGIVAAIASTHFVGDPRDVSALLILAIAIIAQFPVFQGLGIETREFGTKDKLYVIFMTFVLWFISWSLLMTTGALQ